MKVTKRQLKRIIKEEKAKMLQEFDAENYVNPEQELLANLRQESWRWSKEAPYILDGLELPSESEVLDSPQVYAAWLQAAWEKLAAVQAALEDLDEHSGRW